MGLINRPHSSLMRNKYFRVGVSPSSQPISHLEVVIESFPDRRGASKAAATAFTKTWTEET